MRMKKKQEVNPLPFPVYFWAVVAVAVGGLANSIYLAFSHYRVHTDILYTSFCAVSQSINCDTVSQSPYSIFLGVPIPIWGIFGYLFFLLLLSFAGSKAADRRRIWPVLILISLGFCLYSLILAYISRYYIHAYCLMCIVGYGINFLLLLFTWIAKRRFSEKGFFRVLIKDVQFLWSFRKRVISVFTPMAALGIALLLFFPHYWHFELPEISANTNTGVTEDGSAWIGAETPELVITEYTDYMCFQCKKMHAYMRQIVEKNPDKIRLVHKHFPMDYGFNPIVDEPYHEGAAKLAIASAYALYEDRFWQMNDRLYDIPSGTKTLNIKKLAEETGINYKVLLGSPRIKFLRSKVKLDIIEGIELGITGTPAYLIDGELYQGRIPIKVIKKAME